MKKIIIISILVGFAVVPVAAEPAITFSPGGANAGGWLYSAGTITFQQNIIVDKGLGNPGDSLVNALVYLPSFSVTGMPGGLYTLTPITSALSIKSQDGLITYLSGNLNPGDLFPIGTTGLSYTSFQVDINDITVNNTINSAALTAIAGINKPKMDFELTFVGASGGFKWMLDNNKTGQGDFSGAMTIYMDENVPEPATICLLGLGTLSLIYRRK